MSRNAFRPLVDRVVDLLSGPHDAPIGEQRVSARCTFNSAISFSLGE